MAVTTEYWLDTLQAIKESGLVTDEQWANIAKYGLNADDYSPQLLRSIGYDVTVSPSGKILSYSRKATGTITDTATDLANLANSNTQTGTAAAANTAVFNSIGDVTKTATETGGNIVSGSGALAKFTSGVKGVLNTPVAGKVAPAIIATMTGVKLGKLIDGAIYNIGTAMGADLPESLDPDTWNTITADMSDTGWEGVNKWAFNTILGLDPDSGTATAYADENAFAYMARYLQELGFFNTGAYYAEDETITDIPNQPINFVNGGYVQFGTNVRYTYNSNLKLIAINVSGLSSNQYYAIGYSSTGGTTTITRLFNTTTKEFTSNPTHYTYNNKDIYCYSFTNTNINSSGNNGAVINNPNYTDIPIYTGLSSVSSSILQEIGYILLYGNITGGSIPDGVTDTGTVPDLSTGTDQSTMLELLKTLYPELWENRVENEVLQPDGTTQTYTYIPLPIPTGGTGTNTDSQQNTQTDTEVNPDTATQTQLATLIKWLTQNLTDTGSVVDPDSDYDPTGMVDPETGVDPDTGDPTTGGTDNPDPTGTGDTPTVVLPTGQASSLYAIYNPTLAEVNSLGAWLWSSDFIDQILKLFSDPMQAIIGLHKIYATPVTGGAQNIKVGYLDSGVSSNVVTNQYTTVDCGSVNLFEYFGNIFDYDPYTQIRLYLPFIGIVNLSTSDCMRGVISVVYHVDVLSGACLAEVKITRDGVGGTLYQFAGNAAVTMPISSGSYIGVIANVVGVASSVVGGFASGGALGAVAGGVTGALTRRGGTEVQHSGNFSGSAGAMGIKTPYLIIERPQTELATGFQNYIGYPSNKTVVLSTCSGYIKVKEVHLENVPATGEELTQIENLLKGGVII